MIELHPGEKIVLEVRRHWFSLLLETFFLVIFILVPFFILGFLSVSRLVAIPKFTALFVFGSGAWLLVGWMLFFVIWTNYYLDVWIVTDTRIIDVEQHYLFSREISELRLEKIQDVTVEIRGLLATFLRFGDIHVQTAGDVKRFTMRGVPRPERVKEVIFREHDRIVKGGITTL